MPTVLRLGGLRVAIYPNDHRPAHAHVVGPDREAVFILNCPDGPPRLRGSFGFGLRELNQVEAELERAVEELCETWSRIHGDY